MELNSHIIRETVIGAIINGIISAGFYFAVFHGQAAPSIWGLRGLVLDCVPQGIMIGLMSVIVPTLLTRRAAARGQLSYKAHALPATTNWVALGLAGALAGGAAITASAALAANFTGVVAVPFHLGLALKVTAGCLLPCALTPIAIRATLSPAAPVKTS